MADAVFELPFDQFQRYQLLADAVRAVEAGAPRAVIEVGGWPPKLADFLPGREITVVDQVDAEAAGYVRASGAELPFPDRSCGLAVSIDALEHVAPAERGRFIAELCRVATDFVILAAPFADPAVQAADRAVFDFIRAQSGYEHPFLKEHLEIAPPELAATVAEMQARGLDVEVLPSGRLDRWLLLMVLYYTLDGDPDLKSSLPGVMAAYNHAFYRFDIGEPAYRHFLIGAKAGLGEGRARLRALIRPEGDLPETPRELNMMLEFARTVALRAKESENAALRARVEARDAEIAALKELNAALRDFQDKVKSLPLYGLYEQVFKKKK